MDVPSIRFYDNRRGRGVSIEITGWPMPREHFGQVTIRLALTPGSREHQPTNSPARLTNLRGSISQAGRVCSEHSMVLHRGKRESDGGAAFDGL
jgi:hypothetical protein